MKKTFYSLCCFFFVQTSLLLADSTNEANQTMNHLNKTFPHEQSTFEKPNLSEKDFENDQEKDSFYYLSYSGNGMSFLSSGYADSFKYPFYLSLGKRSYITENHGIDLSLCAGTSKPFNIYTFQSFFLYRFSNQIYLGPEIRTGVYFPTRDDDTRKKILPTLGMSGIVGYEFPFRITSKGFMQVEISAWDLFYHPKALPYTTKVNLGFGF